MGWDCNLESPVLFHTQFFSVGFKFTISLYFHLFYTMHLVGTFYMKACEWINHHFTKICFSGSPAWLSLHRNVETIQEAIGWGPPVNSRRKKSPMPDEFKRLNLFWSLLSQVSHNPSQGRSEMMAFSWRQSNLRLRRVPPSLASPQAEDRSMAGFQTARSHLCVWPQHSLCLRKHHMVRKKKN